MVQVPPAEAGTVETMSSAQADEAGAARGRDDVVGRLRDAEVRVGRAQLVAVGGDDAEDVRVEGGLAADRREVVAGRRDHHDAPGDGIGDCGASVGFDACDRERLHARKRSEAHVDHVGAVVGRPADAGGDLLEGAAV